MNTVRWWQQYYHLNYTVVVHNHDGNITMNILVEEALYNKTTESYI